jgi:tetratricopeptide (TPR) repeat protein
MADADSPELVSLGYIAEVTYHRSETAVEAWRQAVLSGHPDAAPKAAYNLGWLLDGQEDKQGAMDAYQKAIDSGHADLAPKAAINL